jgi:hypothetical protein
LKVAGVWLCACATACAAARPPGSPVATSIGAGAPAPTRTAPPPPLDLEASVAVGVEPGESQVFLRTDLLRDHPVGAHAGPVLALWPGWRDTLKAFARDPLLDLDWIEVVGPADRARGRMLAGASEAGAPAIDGRLIALQARSAEPAASHVERSMPAAVARLDGVLRVIFRSERRVVAATAATNGQALSHLLERARVHAPALRPREVLRADLVHPHDTLHAIPASITRLRGGIVATPAGDADATAEGECAGIDDAKRAASFLRETIERQNSPLVRLLTLGLLDTIAVSANGAVVSIHAPANRGQLEALLTLVNAATGFGDERAP